jgi:sialate O-acetylesterase
VEITFDQELIISDRYGYIKGFAIAGKDGVFKWAKASGSGNIVTVWNEEIDHPLRIRYGWADNPDDLNIYNESGLPASPFRINVLK